jgi:hypothetical protein
LREDLLNINKTSEIQETHQDMKSSHQKYNLNKNDVLIKEKSVLNDVMDFLKKI